MQPKPGGTRVPDEPLFLLVSGTGIIHTRRARAGIRTRYASEVKPVKMVGGEKEQL